VDWGGVPIRRSQARVGAKILQRGDRHATPPKVMPVQQTLANLFAEPVNRLRPMILELLPPKARPSCAAPPNRALRSRGPTELLASAA